ncbi:hypothetical protein SNE40_021573 [Patella caerulea]|uniref:Carbohydrate kinase PfkB domain-containing protein n=1 Tax=Patella caerulea TaxID=87958 RepID=A0AAN8IXP9_PATCE
MASNIDTATKKEGKLVLCIGWTCIDIVNIVEFFPKEDADSKIVEYYWQRGGNANNSSTVLSVLGRACELLSVIAKNSREYDFLMSDINKYGIKTDNCVFVDKNQCPLSTAILSLETGSRTILHTLRDIPEITYENFSPIFDQSNKYSWIHFEGRPNIETICNLLVKLDGLSNRKEITTSVELEHPYIKSLELLLDKGDYVFLSKDYAKFRGFSDKNTAVKTLSNSIKDGATIVCAWGEDGAAAMLKGGELVSVPALKLENMIDSLGAGDTFIASFINATLDGLTLKECLSYACLVAGTKCCMRGYDGLSKFRKKD